LGADLADPQAAADGSVSFSRRNRASRARLCFHALLGKAGFSCPTAQQFTTSMKGELAERFNGANAGATVTVEGRGQISLRGVEAVQVLVDWLVDAADTDTDAAAWLKDQSIEAVLALYNPTGNRLGWRWLSRLRAFHSTTATEDYADHIYQDLVAGRLVIVDLSRGTEQVLQLLSERIINQLLARATERFTSGQVPHRMQIVIEEAHRLFDRKAYDADSPNPYVRLAKEAAKFRIGLIYATQEVTAVAPAVLANTSNWIVAHLNNSDEIHTLSKYYDFKSFETAILSSEDRGFVRVKTRSGKYIVSVQVAKFDRDMINAARADAGLPLLGPRKGLTGGGA